MSAPTRKPRTVTPPTPAELMARAQARYRREQQQRAFEAELADQHRIDAYDYEQRYGS